MSKINKLHSENEISNFLRNRKNYKLNSPKHMEFDLINLKTGNFEYTNDSFENDLDLTNKNFNNELILKNKN